MKTKVTPEMEASQRSRRRVYRQARNSALARLREGMDLRWTLLAPATSFMDDNG